MTDAPGYRVTTANEILCAELDDGAVTERIRLRNSLAEATARAEQAEAERDVLAMKLVMELPICPASFGFCPHDFRHCELPDQSPESEQQCWLSWASQEAAKQGNDKL